MPNIKILGDSIAAGEGCSLFRRTTEVLMKYDTTEYFRCEAPNSWWGLLALKGYPIKNYGCCGAFSYQIREHLDKFLEPEDDVVLILLGLNDRKRPDGMTELRENMTYIVNRIKELGKTPIIMTPLPSTEESEYRPSRIHHTEDVVKVLREVAGETETTLIDNYEYMQEHLKANKLKPEDILLGEGCFNDGLHPADNAQRLIYENVKMSRRLL